MENEEIAQALSYSVYTVANRLRTFYEKLHVINRTQAALYVLHPGESRAGRAAGEAPPDGSHLAISLVPPLAHRSLSPVTFNCSEIIPK